jgi:transcriptional regulator with PAS, ATPase and Fis domain
VLHHATRICERYGMTPKRLSPEFLEMLNLYTWPGNVRELVHAVERAIVAAQQQETVFARYLPESIRVAVARQVTADRVTHTVCRRLTNCEAADLSTSYRVNHFISCQVSAPPPPCAGNSGRAGPHTV